MTTIGTTQVWWVTALAVTWLAVSALWLTVIVITDVPSWPLAVWITATVESLAVLANPTRWYRAVSTLHILGG